MNNEVMQVPETILQQLGGNKFVAMTGAKDFAGAAYMLAFSVSSRMTRNKCNRVIITILASDTYKVQFCKLSKFELKTITTIVGVHCSELQQIFTQETGLVTSL